MLFLVQVNNNFVLPLYFKLDINIDRYIHNKMHVDHDILFGTSYTFLHSKISINDI